ncbi:hypothetical protein CC1G_06703 [Coprinopsis cinerea okayama7|uniref:Cell wall protein PhiA n=1 Tax=Coprinopsis cinerea (strain Okayama-7 / 130 / ATCC MYA-4618 / FGSC 9003) TaxID=240176 RepID=A8P831_COPC7|nr:hypothetical protein CC1G_06703 [Coprinopsis cinerea okayama7\|eukprot:XP_001839490.1 hypothetical protein CC1G_06703 [Coprinopsis cinerea okayama7\
MKPSTLLSGLIALVPSLVHGVTVPGGDTPLFYLVASGPDSAGVNFLPVRLHGGSIQSVLTGTGPIAKYYFRQGQLVALDPNYPDGTLNWRPLVNTLQTGTATCATYGQFSNVLGASTNKCASYNSFYLEANPENSQLGSRLTFNWQGGFYVCGTAKEVWYKVSSSDGPGDCTPIQLYTVPVVE